MCFVVSYNLWVIINYTLGLILWQNLFGRVKLINHFINVLIIKFVINDLVFHLIECCQSLASAGASLLLIDFYAVILDLFPRNFKLVISIIYFFANLSDLNWLLVSKFLPVCIDDRSIFWAHIKLWIWYVQRWIFFNWKSFPRWILKRALGSNDFKVAF